MADKLRQIDQFNGRICKISFFRNFIEKDAVADDLLLIFVVTGNINLKTASSSMKAFTLDKDNFVVVNPDEKYCIENVTGIFAMLSFPHEEIYRLLGGKLRIVDCNSTNVRNGSLDGMRSKIKRLFGASVRNELGIAAFEKIGYDILLTLLSEYSEELTDNDRKSEVKSWIDNNLREPISLETASDHFGLTQPYFSKWFKETFSVSFLKYISQKRCENACKDLLNTNNTLLRIALDNGFPNAASFTNTFTRIYNCSPLQYKKKHQDNTAANTIEVADIMEYLDTAVSSNEKTPNIIIDCNAPSESLCPYWNSICNFGIIKKLENYDVQNQLRLLQQSIHFKKARISLDENDWNPSRGFYSENRVLEFLYEINISPIFVINYRTFPKTDESFMWIEEFIKYISHKYGLKQITIELFYDTFFNKKKAEEYNQCLKKIRKITDSLRLKSEIMGPGLLLSPDGKNLENFIIQNNDIDTVSIRCVPIEVFEGHEYNIRIMSDDDYVIHQYSLAKKILTEQSVYKEIAITSITNSFSETDRLNDTSWIAARLMRTAINGYGKLTSLPIETPLDIMNRDNMDEQIFNGNSGIITRNNLKKPSFYAYQFLTHLDENMLYKDEHMMVTESFNGYFQLVVQNCCPLSYEYYLNSSGDKNQTLRDDDLFESKNPYFVSLTLKNVPDGEYFMKVRRINEQHGNVFHAFKMMNYNDFSFVGKDEMELLRLSSCPDMHGARIRAANGELKISIELAPNEIQHIHLIPVR